MEKHFVHWQRSIGGGKDDTTFGKQFRQKMVEKWPIKVQKVIVAATAAKTAAN